MNKAKPISIQKTKLKDGNYPASWSAYTLKIFSTDSKVQVDQIETTVGVRGSNIQAVVRVFDKQVFFVR